MTGIAYAFLAGWWAGLGAHWLTKSRPIEGVLYFISGLVSLGLAIWRVYSIFARTGPKQDSTSV
jgi:hypothetical protein